MLSDILVNTPLYAWVILGALILLGLLALRKRTVSPVRLAVGTGLFALYALYSVATSYALPWLAIAVWGIGVLITLIWIGFLRPAPRGTVYEPQSGLLHVEGSVIPLAVMMLTYCANYAANAARIMAPQLMANPAFIVVICALLGLCLGLFAGRTLSSLRLTGMLRARPETA